MSQHLSEWVVSDMRVQPEITPLNLNDPSLTAHQLGVLLSEYLMRGYSVEAITEGLLRGRPPEPVTPPVPDEEEI